MTAATVNHLVLLFIVLLTLLLVLSLAAVIRFPPAPALNRQAKAELDTRMDRFENELRSDAGASASAHGRNEAGKKDIAAEYLERRIRQTPRARQRITRYGGITISGVGLVIAIRSLPQFPEPSVVTPAFLCSLGALVAAIAMVYDGSEFLQGVVERRRMIPSSRSGGAEEKLRQCCKRLARDVEKVARRLASETEITPGDVSEAWERLVKPRALAPAGVPAVRPRGQSILRGLAAFAQTAVVAGILYLIFTATITSSANGRYWPILAALAALFIIYLALLNSRALAGIIGTAVSWLAGSVVWLIKKGRDLTESLRRRVRRGGAPTPSEIEKESPATAEGTPDRDDEPSAAAPTGRSRGDTHSPEGRAWTDLAAQLAPANSLARIDTITDRTTITVTVIGVLLVGLGSLTAGLFADHGATRVLAVATVITAALAVASALTAQVLSITRRLNPANLAEVQGWYRRQLTTRAYATQAATFLGLAAALLAGATVTATILTTTH
jgi:hypothetical protein